MSNCSFKWKYPLWYSENIKISDSQFFEMVRSGIWYTKNIAIKETIYQCAPYIGFPKVIDALSVVNEVFVKNNITLPLTEQETVAESRLEKGTEAQAKIFGEGMLKLAALGEEQMPREAYHLATNCFGDYYTRSGIELVTRELLTLAILINLGTEAQIKAHIFGNMSMGQSEDKIKQVAFTCLPYSGYPRLLNALNCIKEVFNPEK